MARKCFFIDLDDMPKTDEDICLGVEKYCGENNLPFVFMKKTSPVIAKIKGSNYEITKKYETGRFINRWILSCKVVN
ncbi:DUF4318 domain-containing protein [Clostridium perfringens]|uniref:DUF4318 domain-containing protein n=1 Tax=Clostridium perfringens TaxID=1502 RepID=UPI000BBAC423|nr:DUF4318 domain-containing protein [Clostridium perfringens]MCX0370209.1 DUF4318 domain-containing protein [Clostridium perfringens]MDK0684779.1 DUF4318 domain-containing protein [Clostridium perfringens]MDK0697461.1 DUF4318 domain-containing protein [Clostridium perfringens]MDM0472755.1 DUF4318 domain-containing protein [Clostridium perfringens]MDM0473576.1 DUF4318 domain-containing protein [Clostridium perfringens]